ncbi:MAG TPA: mucoidy inhibitor MuiA family protein, partial [Ktedonobacteraceae bacterium]
MTELTAPIIAVTVYSDRALVTRRGSIHLASGEHEVYVNDLPHFVRESLRAAGTGPQGTRILSVDVTTTFHSRPPDTALQALQNEIDVLQDQQHLLHARTQALRERQRWLSALGEQSKEFARGLSQQTMKPQDCADFFTFMSQQALQDTEEALRLENEKKRLQEEIEAKQRELDHQSGHFLPDRQAAVVHVSMEQEGDFTLEISYIVMNASWTPQYDVRVQKDAEQNGGSVELTYLGLVQQKTGEDWKNVSLALSTARPSLAAVLPELNPWYLDHYIPIRSQMMFDAPLAAPAPGALGGIERGFPLQSRGAVKTEEADEEAQAPVEAEIETTSVEQTGTAYVFRVGHDVDIPADGSSHKTTIAYDDLPCTFDYVSAPVLEADVHVRATITNATERVLLKGQANIFLNGEYVGTTQVKMTAPGAQVKIFLGLDDTIKIKRKLVERVVDKGNLLQSDTRRNTYGYHIEVHNYASTKRHIIVRDRL